MNYKIAKCNISEAISTESKTYSSKYPAMTK